MSGKVSQQLEQEQLQKHLNNHHHHCHDDDNKIDEAEEEEYYDDDDNYYEPDDSPLFPTHPAFTIPVEIKLAPQYGPGQYGIFAAEDIPAETSFWIWTHRVQEIHFTEIKQYIQDHFVQDVNEEEGKEEENVEQIRKFLRQGFVMPAPYDEHWNHNPTDASCFMNHSSTPNCGRPKGTLRLIRKGEELTMDYTGNGNPKWYQELCHKYGILTAVEIAQEEAKRGGLVKPALLENRTELTNGTTEEG